MQLAAVILAAGKGTRMKSAQPKVLHRVGGKPMLGHVLDAVIKAGVEKTVVVAGHGREQVQAYVDQGVEVVYQERQLGTAHALLQAAGVLKTFSGTVLVVCGDTPLITPKTLLDLFKHHLKSKARATVLTAILEDPTGYGRVIRDEQGRVKRIVEQKDGLPEELVVREINTGIYCFTIPGLFAVLEQISPANAQGEYYLTDIIALYNQRQMLVEACTCEQASEVMGINNRRQLAAAGKVLQTTILNRLMDAGVTIIDPATTYVDSTVIIEPDTILYPGTIIEGNSKISTGAVIGPQVRISDSVIGENCEIQYSIVAGSETGFDCAVGPFAYIRPGTKIGAAVKIGDFVEIKKTIIGDNSKVSHLSYLGDAVIGNNVNIGAGTITCNYDGKNKYVTGIEDDVFIGSNTSLVAPVKLGAGAVIAAGSTITQDVPGHALGVARQRQINKEGWATKKIKS